MRHLLAFLCSIAIASSIHAADPAPEPPPVGTFMLVASDGNLHAQQCTISQKDDSLYLTVDVPDFLPQTKPLLLAPVLLPTSPSADPAYRAVISPEMIVEKSVYHIDAAIITLKIFSKGHYGTYLATKSTNDDTITGKLLLQSLSPKTP